MLSLQVATGKTKSPWAMIEDDVTAAKLAGGEAEAKAWGEAQVRAAVRAPAPATPAEAAAADRARDEFAAVVGRLGASMRPGAPRVAGGRAVALSERSEEADLERRRQTIAALSEARKAAGRELTTEEANYIRERMAEREEKRT